MRRNGKKALPLLLALVLVVGVLPGAALAADSDFTIENGVLTKYNGPGGNVTIPNGITSIGREAFFDCENLTSVTIPESVIRIDNSAFAYCTGLTSITIPKSVTLIGYGQGNAFRGCNSLTTIYVDPNNNSYVSVDGVVFTRSMDTLVAYPAGKQGAIYAIPDSVSRICDYAFERCRNLTKII